MIESQVKLNENRQKHVDMLGASMRSSHPELAEGISRIWSGAYTDGVYPAKVKHLMAMVLALGSGCRNCVLAQTVHALEAGATQEEFAEALSVVISMRGTTGIAESIRVVQHLDEQGKWATRS